MNNRDPIIQLPPPKLQRNYFLRLLNSSEMVWLKSTFKLKISTLTKSLNVFALTEKIRVESSAFLGD